MVAPESRLSPEDEASSMPRAEVRQRSLTGIVFLTGSSLINLVVGFGTSLVLARLLTPADFGVVALGLTAMLLGAAFADGGLGAAMVQRAEPPTRAELRTLNGIQLTLALAVCLPAAGIALGFGRTGAVTALMVLSLPITALQGPGHMTLTRTMRYDRQVAADVSSQVTSQVLTVVAVVLGAGVWGLACGVVFRAVSGTVLICLLGTGFQRPSLRGWRGFGGILRFGVSFQAVSYAFLAREQGLNIVIALVAGVVPLGIWTSTNRMFQLPALAFNSLHVVGFPAMANVLARGETIGPIILRTVRRAAVAGTLIFATFAAVSPKLIPAVFGARWQDAALIIPLICLSTLLHGSVAWRRAANSRRRVARDSGRRVGVPRRHLARHHRGAPAQHRRRCDRDWESCRRFGRRGGAQRGDEASVGRRTVPTSPPTARVRAIGWRPRLAVLRRGSCRLLDRGRGRGLDVRLLRAWPLGRVPQRPRRHRPTRLGIGPKRCATPSQAIRGNRVSTRRVAVRTDTQPVKVTVGIPTFNRAGWLRESIESVLAQTFADFRLIVSDNASDDGTPEVVQSFDDDRIHYVRSQRNVGSIGNFNRLIALAETEFLVLLGDDDVLYPGHLAAAVDVLERFDAVGLVHSAYEFIDAQSRVVQGVTPLVSRTPVKIERRDRALEYMAVTPGGSFPVGRISNEGDPRGRWIARGRGALL